MNLTLARLVLRRIVITAFIAGTMIGLIAGYTWKTLEISL